MTTVKARFDGRVIIPEEPVRLPTDRAFEIQVPTAEVEADEDRPGSPRALLRAVQSLPPIPHEWIEEFQRGIDEASQPPDFRGMFDDLPELPEGPDAK
jgi:hypothetical protein